MPAFEQLRTGPENPDSTRDRLRALAGQVPNAANANALAAIENSRVLSGAVGQRMRIVATKINTEAQTNRGLEQDPTVLALRQALRGDGRRDIADFQLQKVDDILSGLRMRSLDRLSVDQMLRTEVDTRDERYIESRSHTDADNAIDITYWGTRPGIIENDRALLTSWRDTNAQSLPPAALAGINTLIGRLNALAQADLTRLRAAEAQREMAAGGSARGLNYMGRMTLIAGGTGMALLSGLMMFANGSFSPTIALYAGIALAAAYPNMLFGQKEQQTLEMAGALFKTPSYIYFQGRLPAAAFGVLTTNLMDDDNRALVNSLTKQTDPAMTDENIRQLVDALLPASNQTIPSGARDALRSAIREQPTYLRGLANALKPFSSDDDGRQLAIDGARLGAPRQSLIQGTAQELRSNPGAAESLRPRPPSSAGTPG